MNNNKIKLPTELAQKVANRKLVEVQVNHLVTNPLQPPTRMNTDAPKYKELLASVRDVGILDYLHYSSATMHTFDGHRRTLALQDIGTRTVYVSEAYAPRDITLTHISLSSSSIVYISDLPNSSVS